MYDWKDKSNMCVLFVPCKYYVHFHMKFLCKAKQGNWLNAEIMNSKFSLKKIKPMEKLP